jgi:hypothetical protein
LILHRCTVTPVMATLLSSWHSASRFMRSPADRTAQIPAPADCSPGASSESGRDWPEAAPSLRSFLAMPSGRPCHARIWPSHARRVHAADTRFGRLFRCCKPGPFGLLLEELGHRACDVVMLVIRTVGDVLRHRYVTRQIATSVGVGQLLVDPPGYRLLWVRFVLELQSSAPRYVWYCEHTPRGCDYRSGRSVDRSEAA